MTSEAAFAAPLQNGVALSAHLQADFYAKLSRIESEVLAGKHPRLKLSREALEKFVPAFSQVQPKSVIDTTPSHPNAPFKPPILSPQRQQQQSVQHPNLASPVSQRPNSSQLSFSAKPPSASQIDPILLTKSDDLVRAESHLKRQRIEKALKDGVEARKKKGTTRNNAELVAHDAPNRFDGSKVLTDALMRVKPISGIQAAITNEASIESSSFDENSYYSSKVNSWTSEELENIHPSEADRNVHVAGSTGDEGSKGQSQAMVGVRTQSGQHGMPYAQVPPGSYSVPDKSPRNIAQQADGTGLSSKGQHPTRQLDEQREESYSPPGVNAFANQSGQNDATLYLSNVRTPPTTMVSRARDSESYSPPSPAGPPVNNNMGAQHLSHIFPSSAVRTTAYSDNESAHRHNQAIRAPQQAIGNKRKRDGYNGQRQSNAHLLDNVDRSTNDFQNQRNTSGSHGRQPLPPQQPPPFGPNRQQNNKQNRKRKKDQFNGQQSPKPANKRIAQGQVSPIPYIKEEPVSPPPISSAPRREAPRRLVLRDDGHADIEIYSPPREQYASGAAIPSQLSQGDLPKQSQQGSRYANHGYRDQMPIVIDSPQASTPTQRQPIREAQDMRRVASVQYAARPYSTDPSAGPYQSQDIQYIRAPSRQIIERPLQSEQYIEAPSYRYRQPAEPTSPTYRFDDEIPVEVAARRAMPPPPNRRIVDQYGNEYIAVPASSNSRQSVAREVYPEPRQPYQQEGYRESSGRGRAQTIGRPQSMRPPAQVIELDDDEDDYRRMPPPPSSTRQRFVEVAQPARRTVSYQPPLSARAMSLQPAGQVIRDPYIAQPPSTSYINDTEQYVPRERPYSARPQVIDGSPTFTRRVEYGTPSGMYRNW